MAEDRPASPPGRDLPAPYQDPWTLLGRDLRAVLASARLRLWELARRNRQGDLALPDGWPRALRAWFWPLVLCLLLAALVSVIVLVPPLLAGPGTPDVVTPAGQHGPPSSTGPAEPAPSAEPPPPPAAEARPAAPEPPPPAAPADDPLLALLASADPARLIEAVHDAPAASCLELQLAAGFTALSPAAQERQAGQWRSRAQELGYERLELVDAAGHLLGRTARVGSGMILLTSEAPPADAP